MPNLLSLPLEIHYLLFAHLLCTHRLVDLSTSLTGPRVPSDSLRSPIFHINKSLREAALHFFFSRNQIDIGSWTPYYEDDDYIDYKGRGLPRSWPWGRHIVHMHITFYMDMPVARSVAEDDEIPYILWGKIWPGFYKSFGKLETLVICVVPAKGQKRKKMDEELLKRMCGGTEISGWQMSRRIGKPNNTGHWKFLTDAVADLGEDEGELVTFFYTRFGI